MEDDERADEDDERGGRRGWPEVISQRRACDGDDDGDEAAVDPNQIWARARMMAVDPGLGAAHEWERREPGRWRRWRETGEARGGGWRLWGAAAARWLSGEE